METANDRITPRMLLDRLDRLEQRMNEQFEKLRGDLEAMRPRCADHEARLRQIEEATRIRTWESRALSGLAALVAAIATLLGWKGVTQ